MANRFCILTVTLFLVACGGSEFTSSFQASEDGSALGTGGGDVTGDGGVTPASGGVTGTGGAAGAASGGTASGGAGAGSGGAVTAAGGDGSGGLPGSGGAPACAPETLLPAALKTALPRTFAWQQHRECHSTATPGGTVIGGSECQNTPCAVCVVVWGQVKPADGGVDVTFTATCTADAWGGDNYCDARWAEQYKQACRLSVAGSGAVHIPIVDTTTSADTVHWTLGTPRATGDTWTSAPETTCAFFAPNPAQLGAEIAASVAPLAPTVACP